MQTHHTSAFNSAHQSAIAADPFTDETLVTQTKLKEIAGGISDMTVWRWRRAGLLPDPVSIRGRNYWKVRVVRAALNQLMGGVAA
ncbi:hypothetical protein CCR95_20870 [Thiocystis minor]|uniref:helix-turn-helix transcriptional regulator n=1 Tax=Thiocystis minor TaxID=61597 RepID=UPI001914CE12|nr:hypothetical protein [Thiocystis minor]MBK5966459.1 hypothetical protein [Thiocystis minor]